MVKKIAFVPLRAGSKSIPFKNIKILHGKPLCFWLLKTLQQSVVDEIYVATNSEEITNIVNSFGFSKVRIYMREEINAQDSSSTEDVILEFLHKNIFNKETIFILAQATSPLTTSEDINNAVLLLEKEKSDSLLSAILSKRFFWNLQAEPINYNYKKRPRRQDFEGYFMENGAFYINSVSNILESRNRLSGKISIYIMPEYTALELDEEIDWLMAEILMKYINI